MRISSDYPFSSRAASYGDGCFTTAAVESGEVELLDPHIQRLKNGCQQINIKVSKAAWQALEQHLTTKVRNTNKGVLKVIISAGEGGRGYARSSTAEPIAYVHLIDGQPDYTTWRNSGVTLGVSEFKIARQPALKQIKHLNRLEQTLIKSSNQNADDMLVLDTEGMIVEVSAANVFWRANNRWYTPELDYSGVSGVMRNHIIKQLGVKGSVVSQVRASLSTLSTCTDMFICNSLMRLVPVTSLIVNSKQTLQFHNQNIQNIVSLLSDTVSI
ncbi:aminodeoxychorismate lyase [Planctobacterium marinum]|uniref:Aminodeoxychorismate lyase n=1 Tax=Planctobacterium marinum TaxID=1631968 RepID=A0AA48HVI9_9ALTE|nr:aminodeoxychorismate lyase [Planctobacterium marinum]